MGLKFGHSKGVSPMKQLRAVFLSLACVAMAAAPLAAHHGRGATFDMQKRLPLKGVVSQVK